MQPKTLQKAGRNKKERKKYYQGKESPKLHSRTFFYQETTE